jgi:hypothetical protein
MKTAYFSLSTAKAIIITIVLSIVVTSLSAQSHFKNFKSQKNTVIYKGFDVSFGGTVTSITSDISKLHKLSLTTEGGSAGFIFGTEAVRTTSKVGFYYSSSAVPQTVDQLTFTQAVNFYPIAMLKRDMSRCEFYLIAGGDYHLFKFAGNYLSSSDPKQVGIADKYIGKVSQLAVNAGFGIEYKIFDNTNFMHIYGQVRHSAPLATNSKSEAFQNTTLSNQMLISVGIRYGFVK